MARTLVVDGYELTINGSTVECDADDFDLFFDDRTHMTLHVKPDTDASFELMSCQEKQSGSLFMDHLFVPDSHRGDSFGKVGVAFFYYLLDDGGYRKFSIKFGGGNASARFLGRLGFDHSDINSKKDVEYAGQSVMVGKLTEQGRHWSLRPISKSRFPTKFFTLK